MVQLLTYLGHMVQGRRRSQFYAGIPDRRLPQSEWIIVENTHEPLVDRETFDRVQALRQADKEKYHANLGKYDHLGTEENIFRGLVFCGDCGRPMVRYKEVSHEKKVFYRFICPNYADLVERSGCAYKYLPVDDLKTVLSRLIAQEVALAADVAALLSKRRSSTVSAASLELARASSERASLDVLRERLMRDLLAGVLSKEDYDRMKQKYAQEGQELDKRIAQLQKTQRREKELLTTRNPWLTVFRQHTGEIQLTDKLVHTLVERITVYKNNRVEICLKYQDERAALLDALEQHGKEVSA